MRIISGNLKGKKLNFLNAPSTRPLKDMVRESIFNTILHSNLINVTIPNSLVLDIYSGTGSFGIECISRGASVVNFVEKDKDALKILKENLDKLSINDRTSVFPIDVQSFFKRKICVEKFDLFFLDPPFSDKDVLMCVNNIKEQKIFKPNNLVIIHREKDSKEDFNDFLSIIKINTYGRSKIIFGSFYP